MPLRPGPLKEFLPVLYFERMMISARHAIKFGMVVLLSLVLYGVASAQEAPSESAEEFGPVVRAFLGYLDNEQEVVDDRASRHEISAQYYRRNSNRIRALRKMAINIARESNNDYLPELEAATRDELKTLFDKPPNPRRFRVGNVIDNMFKFLGTVRAGEVFYLFARLSPYEQAELIEAEKGHSATVPNPSTANDARPDAEPAKPSPTVKGSP